MRLPITPAFHPVKCKELSVDFLRYNSWNWKPILVGGAFIERVSCFKLLGVHISDDLTWAAHCDNQQSQRTTLRLKSPEEMWLINAGSYCCLLFTYPICPRVSLCSIR